MATSGTRKTVWIILGIFGALILVAILGIALIWGALRKGEPTIRDNSVLALRVAGTLPDYTPDDPFKKAKVDKRIKAILLDIDMSGVGWGKAEELRDAIADFRSAGKPVYAYLE